MQLEKVFIKCKNVDYDFDFYFYFYFLKFSPWAVDASVEGPPVQRDQVDVVKDDATQGTEIFLEKIKITFYAFLTKNL